jgi:5-methylcytosine-specific restriction endonuclease McrA
LTTHAIAEKFVQYYWRQVVPYASAGEATILQQNTDRQAAIVNLVREAHTAHGGSLAAAMHDLAGWRRLVRTVARVVREMPLWRLQRIGVEQLNFLYENRVNGAVIHLLPGIAYCFRKFHALISDLVQGAWVRYVRQQNLTVIGETADLHEFLFGSERNSLAIVRPVLLDLQQGRCFYCNRGIGQDTAQVDHFVAWARYPVDLAHNFVLADSRCNGKKRDRLPTCEHLAAWTERNAKYGEQLGDALGPHGIVGELATSNRVAQWAYAQTEAARGLTWLRADEMVPLAAGWRDLSQP